MTTPPTAKVQRGGLVLADGRRVVQATCPAPFRRAPRPALPSPALVLHLACVNGLRARCAARVPLCCSPRPGSEHHAQRSPARARTDGGEGGVGGVGRPMFDTLMASVVAVARLDEPLGGSDRVWLEQFLLFAGSDRCTPRAPSCSFCPLPVLPQFR